MLWQKAVRFLFLSKCSKCCKIITKLNTGRTCFKKGTENNNGHVKPVSKIGQQAFFFYTIPCNKYSFNKFF